MQGGSTIRATSTSASRQVNYTPASCDWLVVKTRRRWREDPLRFRHPRRIRRSRQAAAGGRCSAAGWRHNGDRSPSRRCRKDRRASPRFASSFATAEPPRARAESIAADHGPAFVSGCSVRRWGWNRPLVRLALSSMRLSQAVLSLEWTCDRASDKKGPRCGQRLSGCSVDLPPTSLVSQ